MSDSSPRRTSSQRVDLEERLAFQERALEQLNRVVAEQQLELDVLQREVKELRLAASRNAGDPKGEARTLEDDRPPHY
ncbi:MAG: SlyX family protein [Planctomycetota bacterium]